MNFDDFIEKVWKKVALVIGVVGIFLKSCDLHAYRPSEKVANEVVEASHWEWPHWEWPFHSDKEIVPDANDLPPNNGHLGDVTDVIPEDNFQTSTAQKVELKNGYLVDDLNYQDIRHVEGKPTAEEIRQLSNDGVKFIFNIQKSEEYKKIEKFRVIFIYSDDRENLKDLYSIREEQVDDVISFSGSLKEDGTIIKVDSEEDLKKAINNEKLNGSVPILVLHNNNGMLFGKNISDFGVTEIITCKSSTIGSDQAMQSIQNLCIENVMKSISNIQEANLFNFYSEFTKRYIKRDIQERSIRTGIIGSVSIAVIGFEGVIIYDSNQRRSKIQTVSDTTKLFTHS